MMIMEVAKVSSKGQITIPVSVRNKLKLRTGDKIVILEENGRFYDLLYNAILRDEYYIHKENGDYEMRKIIKRLRNLRHG